MPFVQVELAGGLGNRLFQYAFARAYAERMGCELHTKPHIWQRIFDLGRPDLPPIACDRRRETSLLEAEWNGDVNINITGMAQHQMNLLYSRAEVRKWFKLKPEMEELVRDVPSLPIVASLRRGDYLYICNPFVVIDNDSYLVCCIDHGLDSTQIYWLDGENHYRVPGIAVHKPWVQLSNEEREVALDFLPDLVLMMRAKILLRSNSTFAWWAATLGNNERVFCPDVARAGPAVDLGEMHSGQRVPFVEGNHTPVAVGHHFLSDLHLRG